MPQVPTCLRCTYGAGRLVDRLCAPVSLALMVSGRPWPLVCGVPGPCRPPGPAPLPVWRLRPGLRARAAHLDNPPTTGTKAHCLGPRWRGSGRGAVPFTQPACGRRGLRSDSQSPRPCLGTQPGCLLGRHPHRAGPAPTMCWAGSYRELGLSFPV